jgi:SAM-dependent methyltransferase
MLISRTYDFIVELAKSEIPPPARLLDFGCGQGQAVTKALAAGYDAHGADLYAGIWEHYRTPASALKERLHLMPAPGQLPFDDASFDVIITNQVFEHIENKQTAIAELARVLRPNGRLIAIFPTLDVIMEPHYEAPFVHRLRNGSLAQKRLLQISHRFGLATKSPPARKDWVAAAMNDLEKEMFYVRDSDVPKTFAPEFTLTRRAEHDFIRDRLAVSRRLKFFARTLNNNFCNAILRHLCVRLANGVYVFSRTPAV